MQVPARQPSDRARRVAQGSRRVVRGAQALPVVGMAADGPRLRNRVPDLLASLRNDPHDPLLHWWLAEALDRAEAESEGARHATRYWGGLSGTLTRAVSRRVVGSLMNLDGEGRGASPAHLQCRRTFEIALSGLRHDPTDARCGDVLARIYLRLGYPHDAVQCARLATLAAPDDVAALLTLSQASMVAERTEDAHNAARAALRRGSTIAGQLLTEWGVGTHPPADLTELESYHGPAPLGVKETVMAVGREQHDKARRLRRRPTADGAGSAPSTWLPDPHDPATLREWDGTSWTGRTATLGGTTDEEPS